jgi:hypothetical protein
MNILGLEKDLTAWLSISFPERISPIPVLTSYEMEYHSTNFPMELAFTIAIVDDLSALVNYYYDTANR